MDVTAIDDYVAGFSPDVQALLQQMRSIIHEAAPAATETISYGIPTFDLNGKHLVHFAAFTRHIGLYPMPSGMERFAEEFKRYKHGKGSVRFPITEPLPVELVREVVEFRIAELGGTG